jgi:exo-beta-1,3-glucanase (GH17 family)
MSNPYQRKMSLAGINLSGYSEADLRALVRQILDEKIHGLSFSPYVEGQGPGTQISDAQIRERLAYIQPYVNWVRSFSCKEGNENIPRIAAENGLKNMVGVWLDDDKEQNEVEINKKLRRILLSAMSMPTLSLLIILELLRPVMYCSQTAIPSGKAVQRSMLSSI